MLNKHLAYHNLHPDPDHSSPLSHMIDGEPDGETVQTELPLRPSVLLHEGHDDGALLFVIVFVRVSQVHHVLRVMRERACGRDAGGRGVRGRDVVNW